jgi:hypothetical protein
MNQVDLLHSLDAVVHAMEIKELLRGVGKTADIVQELLLLPAGRHCLEIGVQDGDRRAQLMRGVGQKALLLSIAVIETRQRRVHGLDERKHFLRDILDGKSLASAINVDACGDLGDAAQTS